MACSFSRCSGSPCGKHPRPGAEIDIVSLVSCHKDISFHLSYYKFGGIQTEVDLILARTGTFSNVDNLSKFTICSFHRDIFRIGWKRPISQFADSIAAHKTRRTKPERDFGKALSQEIFTTTKCLIPVGSGKLPSQISSLKNLNQYTKLLIILTIFFHAKLSVYFFLLASGY